MLATVDSNTLCISRWSPSATYLFYAFVTSADLKKQVPFIVNAIVHRRKLEAREGIEVEDEESLMMETLDLKDRQAKFSASLFAFILKSRQAKLMYGKHKHRHGTKGGQRLPLVLLLIFSFNFTYETKGAYSTLKSTV